MPEQDGQDSCTVRHLNHVGMAVRDIADTLAFYQEFFGVGTSEIEDVPDQGVKVALVRVGASQLEFIQPTDSNGAVARFIERHGEAVHHICFEVEDLQDKLDLLAARGVELVDTAPRQGISGRIAFLHPRSTRGVLIELVDQETARR